MARLAGAREEHARAQRRSKMPRRRGGKPVEDGGTTRCSWAWEAPVSAPKSCGWPSGRARASAISPCPCSTIPLRINAFENKIDLTHALFIVSSQVGEHPGAQHLQADILPAGSGAMGVEEAGNRFIAITDPGSKLQHIAESDGFRRIFFGVRVSAGGTQPCQILAWSRPRSWVSTSRLPGSASRRWCMLGDRSVADDPDAVLESSWACWPTTVAIKSRSSPRPASRISVPGWSSSWRSPRARMARA